MFFYIQKWEICNSFSGIFLQIYSQLCHVKTAQTFVMLNNTQAHNDMWQYCLDRIKAQTSAEEFEKWFQPIVPLEFDGTTLRLRVPNESYVRQIEKNYKKNKGSVLASGPLMLKDGEYYDWSQCNANFIETKHPRSAICLTEEGKILFVTVDGRSPENAVGINIPELAHLLHVLGGKDALNLDGGGSTALWLSGAPEEGIVNFPCDNRNYDHQGERKVANFLYVH